MSAGNSNKAIVAAFLANLGIAFAKFVGFMFTGSSAMMAESIHSAADTGNQGLLFLGQKLAARKATKQHPFGFGRERYFWAFVVSMVIFTLGSVFSISEGIDKIFNPAPLEDLGWAIGILIAGLGLEGWSFRTAIGEAKHLRGRSGWFEFIRKARSPELPIVLLEDTGALIGLLIALTAVSLSAWTGNPLYDGVGTVMIGTLLGAIALILAREMRSLLLGEAARQEDREAIVAAIQGSPRVVQLIHMRTQHLGPEEILVGAKVEFERALSTAEIAVAIDRLEAAVRARVPAVGPMYIEPDLMRPWPTPSESAADDSAPAGR